MTSLYLLLLLTQGFALQFTLPSNFGGNTDFSDKGWRALLEQLFPEVRVGLAPTTELNIQVEPTCAQEFIRCSTTYFGKFLALTKPESAQLWVKWHQDANTFYCDKPNGCIVTSASSVADLTSQSDGWSVTASITTLDKLKKDMPPVSGNVSALLSYRFSEKKITPKTMLSTKTLSSRCFLDHLCYMQTGTLMLTISGRCDSRPVIVCDRYHYPCEEFQHPTSRMCSQWSAFTLKHCQSGGCASMAEDCYFTVAVTGDKGTPMSFQIFEQKPLINLRHKAKRDYIEPDSPFGELPDGSSGAWMAWSPPAK